MKTEEEIRIELDTIDGMDMTIYDAKALAGYKRALRFVLDEEKPLY